MTVTAFDLCSRALIKLDATPIQSFDDGSKESQVAAILYESIRDSELTGYFWNFNSYTAELSQEVAAPSDPRFKYSYTLPADLLRLVAAYDPSGYPIRYLEENGRVYADDPRVFIKYQRRIDESTFPAFFQDNLVARLAYEFCEPLIGEASTKQSAYQEWIQKQRAAKRIDAQSNPVTSIINANNSTWLSSRYASDPLRGGF